MKIIIGRAEIIPMSLSNTGYVDITPTEINNKKEKKNRIDGRAIHDVHTSQSLRYLPANLPLKSGHEVSK